jgi:hypothetical protein
VVEGWVQKARAIKSIFSSRGRGWVNRVDTNRGRAQGKAQRNERSCQKKQALTTASASMSILYPIKIRQYDSLLVEGGDFWGDGEKVRRTENPAFPRFSRADWKQNRGLFKQRELQIQPLAFALLHPLDHGHLYYSLSYIMMITHV